MKVGDIVIHKPSKGIGVILYVFSEVQKVRAIEVFFFDNKEKELIDCKFVEVIT